MKRHLLPLLAIATTLAALVLAVQAAPKKAKKLDPSTIHGRIQFVKSFPDYKVKAVTVAHGGSGEVKSAAGEASKFTIRLPLTEHQSGQLHQPVAQAKC